MHALIRKHLKWVALAILSAPLAIVLALLCLPLWRWIEATLGIESIGHSGPAEWCYVATYIVIAVAILWISKLRPKEQER